MIIIIAPGEALIPKVRRMLLPEAVEIMETGTVEIPTGAVRMTMASGQEPSMRRRLQEAALTTQAVVAEAVRLPVPDLPEEAEVDQGINFSTDPFYV